MSYRIYCRSGSGAVREFGIDYATFEAAQRVRDSFAADFPNCRYTIRGSHWRHTGPSEYPRGQSPSEIAAVQRLK